MLQPLTALEDATNVHCQKPAPRFAECSPFWSALVYWFIACTISSSVCSLACAATARVFFMPAISSRMKVRNFSVRLSLTSSVRARLSISVLSWSAAARYASIPWSNCALSWVSISASRLSRAVSRSTRAFLSASVCPRSSVISFTRAAVSTCSFEGNSPRNCDMPLSRVVQRSVSDSIDEASFSMRTMIPACSRSSMSLASVSVKPCTCLLASTRRLISEFRALSSFMTPSCAAFVFPLSASRRFRVSPLTTCSKPTNLWPTSLSLL
mmetsp:Transcript_63740/g.165717  ORF Transcript_63740/g.165717 Transcript_63740/m.165717 type:complete len:268 (+) Transcript_63740:135-938(+)